MPNREHASRPPIAAGTRLYWLNNFSQVGLRCCMYQVCPAKRRIFTSRSVGGDSEPQNVSVTETALQLWPRIVDSWTCDDDLVSLWPAALTRQSKQRASVSSWSMELEEFSERRPLVNSATASATGHRDQGHHNTGNELREVQGNGISPRSSTGSKDGTVGGDDEKLRLSPWNR